ncbi:MAG: transcription elongation factor GreA [Patescibacteria group bacterium]|jgi:transcription elongation factor GreA|nr:transcription elongation factor GreA [Patescibacteria group bacterium]
MESKKIYLTKEGLERLNKEFEELTSNGRKEVANLIKQAKEYGDLSENSEYADAKDKQAFIEGRIAELEHILKNAEMIDEVHEKCQKIGVGCTVNVEVEDGEMKYKIVGSYEADPEKGWISNESPLGQALLGKAPGEEVEVVAPAGIIKYKVKKIQ